MEKGNRYRLKILTIAAAVIGAGVLVLILLPSLLLALGGPSQFFDQPVYSSLSPDGSTEVVVYRRVDFPANEIIDPSITVTIKVRNRGALIARDYVQFNLYEYSDLTEPTMEWVSDTVYIRNIDDRQKHEFALEYK